MPCVRGVRGVACVRGCQALRADPSSAAFSTGQAVNLMATDTRNLARAYTFGHQAWSAPVQTLLASLGLFWLLVMRRTLGYCANVESILFLEVVGTTLVETVSPYFKVRATLYPCPYCLCDQLHQHSPPRPPPSFRAGPRWVAWRSSASRSSPRSAWCGP